MPGGNPNHDPRTGEFTTGQRVVSGLKTVGRVALGAAAVVAGAGVGLMAGAALTAHSQQRQRDLRSHLARQHVRDSLRNMPAQPGLNEALRSAHIKTLRHPQVRAAHQHGLINPARGG